MAQQNNEGTEYLLALKQSSQASAASAPARTSDPVGQELNPDAGNSDEYQGTNKRRAPRYKCEGSVELREEGCDVRTWATFTDIGLHGCYVEAQATYPAGTILNMKLEASGIRVETRGNVRVNYPYLGMGIAFVSMTGENVARLRQLLASICPGCAVMGPGIASTIPSTSALGNVPLISNPAAAIQELIDFFESRQMLMREEFLRILRMSQERPAKS
jgi:hypothetical protein